MNRLFNIADAARDFLGGVGESTLRRWIAEGRVPVVRLGRRVLLRPEALEEFIKAGERVDERRLDEPR